ncbi:MAG: hypothetical protein ACXVGN_02095 [Mycobacteriaceae bacterium]
MPQHSIVGRLAVVAADDAELPGAVDCDVEVVIAASSEGGGELVS